jgi:hypothetical protein
MSIAATAARTSVTMCNVQMSENNATATNTRDEVPILRPSVSMNFWADFEIVGVLKTVCFPN